ncbi:putative hydrolase [Lasiodiplodia hormozganensis]|uniref:Hydrolase n=1 Tax=Lasiodiplodia hormozganensis TaxID=869390 RepID=A0AA39WG97_9PEZI|nr:putative hydrolase [Lasiodiplodia hormozganensis]
MSPTTNDLVLPRPGATLGGAPQPPIPGPTETAFTTTFGALLPPAKFLTTPTGKAAYYEIPPSTTSSPSPHSSTPDRVLLIHGVQTPALGMLPLARALHASFPSAHLALVDLWGHGLSDTPVVPHDAALFHGLLDAVLDALAWPSAHLIGFSFGGALTVGYVASRPERVRSYALVAPAGLIRSSGFSAEEQRYLRRGGGEEGEEEEVDEAAARDWVLRVLEGGELRVPGDWEERVARGEVVAEAVRGWQMREHRGHTASVVAVFRDGGVMDGEAEFVRAAETGIPAVVVLGGLDDLCTEEELKELGFKDVNVVPQVGHGVVRERVPEVAGFIGGFWRRLDEVKSS